MSGQGKSALIDLFRAALQRVHPDTLVRSALDELGSWSSPPHILGAGKAAATMVGAIQERIDPSSTLAKILVVLPTEQSNAALDAQVHLATHPLPSGRSLRAAEACMAFARSVPADRTLLCALSGGASALLTLPAEGLSLDELIATQRVLLGSGLSIHRMNSVRKHLSAIKGGRLAARCRGNVVSLLLSDVADDDPSVIGSGPTVPDPSTYDDALRAIHDAGIGDALPPPVVAHLQRGALGKLPETPKELPHAHHVVVGGPAHLWDAARTLGRQAGYRLGGTPPPKDVGSHDVDTWAQTIADTARRGVPGEMYVWVGEPTVTLPDNPGTGGRNGHLALRVAQHLQGHRGWAFLSVGSDGIDGTSAAAGAVVDGDTWDDSLRAGLNPQEALSRFDSAPFHATAKTAVITGATGSNLLDLQILTIDPATPQA